MRKRIFVDPFNAIPGLNLQRRRNELHPFDNDRMREALARFCDCMRSRCAASKR